jgi:MarR family transcriptional regulator, organic hydroperoxide resistance regulator
MKNYFGDNLYYTTTAFSREISAIAENAFADLGLTPSDAYLIMCVNEKPNIQPTEISEKILLAPSTITRMIEKLEKRDIVTRATEGKYTFVAPTAKGKDIYGSVIRKWDEIGAIFSQKLGDSTISSIIQFTTQAAEVLKKKKK